MTPGSETITVVRAPLVTDPVGNRQYRDWDNATLIEIEGCSFQRRLSPTENNRDREYHEAPFVVFTPIGTDVLATDRIRYDGNDYDVLGVFRWRDLSANLHHQEIRMQLREFT